MKNPVFTSVALLIASFSVQSVQACPAHGSFGYGYQGYQRLYEMYAQEKDKEVVDAIREAETEEAQIAAAEELKARARTRFLSRFNVRPAPVEVGASASAIAKVTAPASVTKATE
ncbi:MAG: hypothetical protein AAF720_11615 [Pseudomonadota bacterium]